MRNLLRLASNTKGARAGLRTSSPLAAALCLCLFATGALLLTHSSILETTHAAIEQVVEQLR